MSQQFRSSRRIYQASMWLLVCEFIAVPLSHPPLLAALSTTSRLLKLQVLGIKSSRDPVSFCVPYRQGAPFLCILVDFSPICFAGHWPGSILSSCYLIDEDERYSRKLDSGHYTLQAPSDDSKN